MSHVDVFSARDLVAIANLADVVEEFNKRQHGDNAMFAEVVFYRDGEKVATLTDGQNSDGSAERGDLRFEVEVVG